MIHSCKPTVVFIGIQCFADGLVFVVREQNTDGRIL
jgi:hypothetical protein